MVRNLAKKYFLLVSVAAVVAFAVIVILVEWVSGGKSIERKVVAVLQTNEFIVRTFQAQPKTIKRTGAWRVYLESSGLRNGFYSFFVQGGKIKGEFKVQWSETPDRVVQILSISRCEPFQQDKLVWERPAADTNKDSH